MQLSFLAALSLMGLAGSTEGEETIVTETIVQATDAVCSASNAVCNASSYVYDTAAYYTGFAAPTGDSLTAPLSNNGGKMQPASTLPLHPYHYPRTVSPDSTKNTLYISSPSPKGKTK